MLSMKASRRGSKRPVLQARLFPPPRAASRLMIVFSPGGSPLRGATRGLDERGLEKGRERAPDFDMEGASARRQSTISTLSNSVRVAKPTGKALRPRSSGQPALRTRAAAGPLAMSPIWRCETSTRLCAVPSRTDSSTSPICRGVGAVRDQQPFVRAEPQSRASFALARRAELEKAARRRTPSRRRRARPRRRAE